MEGNYFNPEFKPNRNFEVKLVLLSEYLYPYCGGLKKHLEYGTKAWSIFVGSCYLLRAKLFRIVLLRKYNERKVLERKREFELNGIEAYEMTNMQKVLC